MATGQTGYQPRNTPAERRAFFDQRRRLNAQAAAYAAELAALREETFYSRQGVGFWDYAEDVTPPPLSGELRTDEPVTHMYLHKIDADGYDRSTWLDFIVERSIVDPDVVRFRVRGDTGIIYEFRSNGTVVDSGDYYTIPVEVLSD